MPKNLDTSPPKTGIVAAVGAAAVSGTSGLGKAIEKAMTEAILQANKDGLAAGKDDAKIKERMAAARQRVKEEFAARAAEANRKAEEKAE